MVAFRKIYNDLFFLSPIYIKSYWEYLKGIDFKNNFKYYFWYFSHKFTTLVNNRVLKSYHIFFHGAGI